MSTAMLSPDGVATLHDAMAGHVEAGEMPGPRRPRRAGRRRPHRRRSATSSFDDPHPPRTGRPSSASRRSPSRSPRSATMSLVEEGVVAPRPARRRPAARARPPPGAARHRRRARRHRGRATGRSRSRICSASGSGSASVMAPPGTLPDPAGRGRARASRASAARRGRPCAHDADGWIAALGSLPLMYQPGEQWLYNTGVPGARRAARPRGRQSDVETVMRERIFEPLGMPDTGFAVPADQLQPAHDRVLPRSDRPARSRCSTTPARQLVEHPAVAPRRQRLAGLDHRRLLGVRVDAARPAARRAAGGSSRRNRWRS